MPSRHSSASAGGAGLPPRTVLSLGAAEVLCTLHILQ